MQTARGTRLDAGRLQAHADAVRAQRALVHFLGRRIEFWDVEWTAGDAILAANAIFLLEIHDAVGVLHDGAIGGTRAQTAGIGAVHALVFAHEPAEGTVCKFVLVETDQVVIIPGRIRHGLIRVVEGGLAERIAVPFEARHLAGFAANAGGDVDQFANTAAFLALRAASGNRARMAGDRFDLQRTHALSSFTRKPLNSGV